MSSRICKCCGVRKDSRAFRPHHHWNGYHRVCRECQAEQNRSARALYRAPKPWPIVRDSFHLTASEEALVIAAASEYNRDIKDQHRSPDAIISEACHDLRRQVELLSCVAYYSDFVVAVDANSHLLVS